MKTWKGVYDRVTDFDNLYRAASRARRGKRLKTATAAFDLDLESNLLRLQAQLRQRTWTPGAYSSFWIHAPKTRLISAAPYRDRVVHHALCHVIEPLFDATFIHDSYANRRGKGTHRAADRVQAFARGAAWCLKGDIRRYFPSIDHDILYERLARRVRDDGVRWLARRIIDSSNPQEPVHHYFPGDELFTPFERRRGLPIGNLTSQFFANLYLDGFDHFMKERVRCRRYVRYVDDFVVLDDDRGFLREARAAAGEYLTSLRLRLHETKCQVFPVRHGVSFVGYRIFPDHRRLCRSGTARFRRRLRALQRGFAAGELSLHQVQQSIQSWVAHAAHADTWGLRSQVLGGCAFRRGPATPGVAWGLVEQQPEQPARRQSQQEHPGQPQRQQRVSLREHF